MSSPITIRAAAATDADAIAFLLGQLGYPATAEESALRLERMNAFPQATALVAQLDGAVIGLITSHVFPSIHAPAIVAWLTTLVVDERHLQKGAGRQLCAAVETWARGHGATRISVTSGGQRGGAHAFYESIGYERTGVRLSRNLV